MSDYLLVKIRIEPSDPWSDLFTQDLGNLGFESFEKLDSVLHAYIPKNDFDEKAYELLVNSYKDNAQIETNIEQIEKENWNIDWESNYDPIEVADEIYIHAVFHKPKPTFKYEILITPKMSFGTGHHATTKLMLTEMLNINFINKTVLDVGTGTGILSIFADIRGAQSVYGIDIDDWSVENAKENILLNNCNDITIDKGQVEDVNQKPYNVILANINYNVILKDLEKYTQLLETEGDLLLSGFLQIQKTDLQNVSKNLGLQVKSELTLGEWNMLHLVKG